MAPRNAFLGVVAVVGIVGAGWLYRDNRRLEDELARARRAVAATDTWKVAPVVAAATPSSRPVMPMRLPRLVGGAGMDAPKAEEAPKESRLDRRLRRQREMADLLGRDPDESEDDYRSRILPFMQLALEKPRQTVDEMRKAAEAAAKVSETQSKELDAAFDEVYTELLDYTNGAITDGQLTPYERNVKGLLQYAGGLGAILEGAEGKVGKILSAEQVRQMSDAGFEWGEYLGVRAPWENLRPPPPRPGG